MRRLALLVLVLFVCAPLCAQSLWEQLVIGNRHFQGDSITFGDLKKRRKELDPHQHPEITVLACSDSRVPPELLFHQTLGRLFVVRAAGNVADTFALASLEYAVSHGYAKLIVVLGHEECGAVKESLKLEDPATPGLLALTQRIRAGLYGFPLSEEPANVRRAVVANTRASAAYLTAQSILIRTAVHEKKVEIIPAYYALESGAVTKID
ncbi:MAG TPA: carbonic anhydrase [Thermoanaerobaculia bacterium]|nr:carbonic anhydrase [Thermoanaerobaculia bacterium]